MGRHQDQDSSSEEDDDSSSNSSRSSSSSTTNSDDSRTDSNSNDPSSTSSGSGSDDSGSQNDGNENFEVGFWQSLKAVMPWTNEGKEVNLCLTKSTLPVVNFMSRLFVCVFGVYRRACLTSTVV